MPHDEMERDYEGESDAETLARAEEIKINPGRAIRARKAAKRLSTERENQLRAINLVAGKVNGMKAGRGTVKGGILGGLPVSPYYKG